MTSRDETAIDLSKGDTEANWKAIWRSENMKIFKERKRKPSDPALVAEHRACRDFAYFMWKTIRQASEGQS